MSSFSRRRFTQLVVGGVALAALSGCVPEPTAEVASGPSSPAPTRPATPGPQRPVLRNENRPGFFVRYYKPFQAVDPTTWTLAVEGLVKKPRVFSLAEVQALPLVAQVSRMKCVECWSAPARWEGFHLRSLLPLVEPEPEATWVHFYCADGYFESLRLEQMLEERVLLVHRMNDAPLPDEYGAPLRLIVPPLYGYKSAKAITRLVLADQELIGYWSKVGPYTTHGIIQRGRDHPLDLGGSRDIPGGREIVYPDGLESQGQ